MNSGKKDIGFQAVSYERLLHLDFIRGLFIIVIITVHAIGHIIWWNKGTSVADSMVPAWVIILLSPLLLLATWAPIFALVSGASNGFVQYKVMVKHNEKSKKKLPLNGIVKGLLINGCALHVVSLIHNTIIHYGYDSWGIAGAPKFEMRTLITGFAETGILKLPDIEFLFYTDAIALMGTTNIVIAVLLFFLWRNNGFMKARRNYILLTAIGLMWFAVSPLFQAAYSRVFFEKLASAKTVFDYLSVLPLKFLIGPPHSTFPNVGFGIFGLIFGIALAQKLDYAVIKRYGIILGTGFVGLTVILLIILNIVPGKPLLSSASVGTSLPTQLHLFNMGLMILVMTYFIGKMDYRTTEEKRIIAKKTVFVRRYSLLAMTIYMCESFIVTMIMKVYIPLWGPDVRSHPVLYPLMIFIMVLISLAAWYVIMKIWEKTDFKYSFEWLVVAIVGKLRGRSSSRLNVQKTLYNIPLESDESVS